MNDGETMWTGKRIASMSLMFLFCMLSIAKATAQSAAAPSLIELLPMSGSLDLGSTDHHATLRQTSTQVRVAIAGSTIGSPYPIEIYACLTTDEALRSTSKSSTFGVADLRIRNDRGEWAALEPLPRLEGRRGVRIAVVDRAPASVLLQVQLKVSAGQSPGNYQGILTLEAQQR